MPGYIDKTFAHFGHPHPATPQNQPHPHTIPTYSATVQYAKPLDDTLPASKEDQKLIRQVIGILLYYARAVDSTLLVALSSLASAQAAPTQHTTTLVRWLLDYVASNPDASSHIGRATWFWPYTVMPPTSAKQQCAAEPEATFSAQMTQATTAQYSTSPKS